MVFCVPDPIEAKVFRKDRLFQHFLKKLSDRS
jgi:archaellum biogenesis protein FlaJ (TadC family)